MIKIIKATQKEIIVKEGPTVYSVTPETAKPEILEALKQQQEKPKTKPTKQTKKTTKKTTNTKKKTTKKTTKKTDN